jgi:hypothetical protein
MEIQRGEYTYNSQTKQGLCITHETDHCRLLVGVSIEQRTCRFLHDPCTLHRPS